MITTIRIRTIMRRHDGYGGIVWYELAYPDGSTSEMRHPFRLGAKGKDGTGAYIWGWDGKEPLTLTPSYECEVRSGALVHLLLTAGKIVLQSDSTVTLHPQG